MGKEHSASVFVSNIQGYGVDLWHSEYNAPIGSPDGPLFQAQNVYMRNYSHGLVIVNPSAIYSYTIVVGSRGYFYDLEKHLVSGVVALPPHSALVLINVSSRASETLLA
jgi:hypothetical protein